jgi:hypothetical protein
MQNLDYLSNNTIWREPLDQREMAKKLIKQSAEAANITINEMLNARRLLHNLQISRMQQEKESNQTIKSLHENEEVYFKEDEIAYDFMHLPYRLYYIKEFAHFCTFSLLIKSLALPSNVLQRIANIMWKSKQNNHKHKWNRTMLDITCTKQRIETLGLQMSDKRKTVKDMITHFKLKGFYIPLNFVYWYHEDEPFYFSNHN